MAEQRAQEHEETLAANKKYENSIAGQRAKYLEMEFKERDERAAIANKKRGK